MTFFSITKTEYKTGGSCTTIFNAAVGVLTNGPKGKLQGTSIKHILVLQKSWMQHTEQYVQLFITTN
jgi:hypothetical protein